MKHQLGERTELGLYPTGIRNWHLADPTVKQVREMHALTAKHAPYLAEHTEDADYEEKAEAIRFEMLIWFFGNMVVDADGQRLPGMDKAEAFDECGWNELRALEALAVSFLREQIQVTSSPS